MSYDSVDPCLLAEEPAYIHFDTLCRLLHGARSEPTINESASFQRQSTLWSKIPLQPHLISPYLTQRNLADSPSQLTRLSRLVPTVNERATFQRLVPKGPSTVRARESGPVRPKLPPALPPVLPSNKETIRPSAQIQPLQPVERVTHRKETPLPPPSARRKPTVDENIRIEFPTFPLANQRVPLPPPVPVEAEGIVAVAYTAQQNAIEVLKEIDLRRVSPQRSSKKTNYYGGDELASFCKRLGIKLGKADNSKSRMVDLILEFARQHGRTPT